MTADQLMQLKRRVAEAEDTSRRIAAYEQLLEMMTTDFVERTLVEKIPTNAQVWISIGGHNVAEEFAGALADCCKKMIVVYTDQLEKL